MDWKIIIGILIPFLGTSLGSFCVFFMKKEINSKVEKVLLGFASGVMIAASIWSLLDPAIELGEGVGRWLKPAIGFMAGILFLLLLDSIIPHMHLDNQIEGKHVSKVKKTTMMVLAVTLHNIPEGLAVGTLLAGSMVNESISITAAITLSIGIAIQNFPEGAIISMPLMSTGVSKPKAFLYGVLSGIVEPIAAILAILLTRYVEVILPYVLAFAAGAMIYVVVEELIPESNTGEHSNLATIGIAIGFVLMMTLDVALG